MVTVSPTQILMKFTATLSINHWMEWVMDFHPVVYKHCDCIFHPYLCKTYCCQIVGLNMNLKVAFHQILPLHLLHKDDVFEVKDEVILVLNILNIRYKKTL